jgi:hypothetical protein
MQAFFDLLAIHELGHAFHFQAKLNMQRKWLAELFVNSLLHAYVAEVEPESLPALTLIAKMVLGAGTDGLTYTSLEDIENLYYEIGQKYPNNYGWYQFRWHNAAEKIYDSNGAQINRKWWDALKSKKKNNAGYSKQEEYKIPFRIHPRVIARFLYTGDERALNTIRSVLNMTDNRHRRH